MASYEAVRIVEIVKGEKKHLKYQLNFDEFEKIFDAVRNVPVAIISIAGACRSGKSFLMTLLADYLLKDPSEAWGSVKQKKLTKVFEHRGGIDGHTNGIYVTRKPFMMKTKDEKEIALFLMDTQGMFDKQLSVNDNSVIFALSTLLSSVQIYNINGLIREDDLQHLQLFTDYAQRVSNKQRNASTSSRDIASKYPFQGLLFLCRNWEQPDYDEGFKGGSEYLKKVMTVDNEENKLVRQRLKDSFAHVCCSLMPHPGKPISKRKFKDRKAVCFADMDKDFFVEVDALVKHLFDKDHLVAKTLNGRELTGEDFIDLAMNYVGILHSGEMPKIETIVKSNERVEFLLRVKDIESNYKKSMQAQMGEMPLVPAQFEALHLHKLSEAKDLFYMYNILEDKAECQKYLHKMERNIGTLCEVVSMKNEAKITRVRWIIDENIKDAGRVYYESLEEFAADCWVEDILKAKDLATRKANAWFQERISDIERQWFDENKRKALQSTFDSTQRQFEKINAERKEVLDGHVSQLFKEAIQKYRNRMEVTLQPRNQDMEQAHEKSKSCALALFNDLNIGNDTKYKERKELELKLKLQEELKEYQQIYEKNMDDELAKVVEQAKQIYSQHIPAVDQYVVEAELESSHVKAEKMAMEVANNEKSKKKVAELINFEKKQWLLNNEVLKSGEEKRITSQRKSLEKEYKSKYEDIKETYVDDAKLQQMHAKALKKAKTDLSYCETQHAEALKKNREELEKNINATFQMVQQTNAENRNSICVKLLEFQSQLRAEYSEKIYEVTRKRYAVMDDLTKMHENFKVAVERKVKPLIPFSDIFEEAIHLSFCKLDAKFEEVKAGNNSWNAFKDTATDIFAAGVNVGKTVLGIPGVVVAAPIAGIAGVVGGLINLRRAVYGEIDVSELKSIRYLQELKLVAKKLK